MKFDAIQTAYLASTDYLQQLQDELTGVIATHGNLILTDQPRQDAYWAQNVWLNPVVLEIDSINDAARKLKAVQRNWWPYSAQLHRRSKLIQEKLPHVSAKPWPFSSALLKSPLGSWTLLDQNTILASSSCSSLFPNGEAHFVEDKLGPPNRAYLKLWEALTLLECQPGKGEFVLDLGGSPGGWAWAVAQLGADVLSVDRSPLDDKITRLPNVRFQKGDAFHLKPAEFDRVDWLLCDVICYPEKLYEWILPWVESGKVKHFICTLKFKGAGEYGIAKRFADIPGSRVRHLFHNKHELTWMWQNED